MRLILGGRGGFRLAGRRALRLGFYGARPGFITTRDGGGAGRLGRRERASDAQLFNNPAFDYTNHICLAVAVASGGTELSLHLKLPGDLSLEEAHSIAEQVEQGGPGLDIELAAFAAAPGSIVGPIRSPFGV